jgi:hypothetical protein
MKKTIKTEYLEERILRLKQEYENNILRDQAENSISRNVESIKERNSCIEGTRLIILGMDKISELIQSITQLGG